MVEMHLATVISVLSLVIAALSFIFTQHRFSKTNTKDASAELSDMKARLRNLETRVEHGEKTTDDNKIRIERRNEEMRDIHRRLNAIDELKIDAELAGIKTELKHIRVLLEKKS